MDEEEDDEHEPRTLGQFLRLLLPVAVVVAGLGFALAGLGLFGAPDALLPPDRVPDGADPRQQEIEFLLKQTRQHMEHLRFHEASALLAQVLEKAPGHPGALEALARCFTERDEIFRAIGTWKQLLALDPAHAEAPLRLAGLYYNGGRYQDALPYARQAVSNAVTSVEAKLQLARVYHMRSDPEQAQRYVDHALAQGGETAETLNQIAHHYCLLGQLDLGEARYRKALDREARKVESYSGLASIARYRGRLAEARRYLDTARAIDPLDVNLMKQHAEIAVVERRWDEARAVLEEILQQQPEQFAIEGRLAAIHLATGDREEGVRRARLMIESGHAGAAAEGHFVLARFYYRMQLYSDAFNHARQVLQFRPEYMEAHMLMARALLGRKDYQKAIFRLREVLLLRSNHHDARLLLAEAHLAHGEEQEGLRILRETVTLHPTRNEALVHQAAYLAKAHRFKEAIESLEEALRRTPGRTDAARQLVELLFEQDLHANAPRIGTLCQLLLATGHRQEVADWAMRLRHADQENHPATQAEGWHLLSTWHLAQGNYRQGLEAAEEVLARDPQSLRAMIKAAQCLFKLGRLESMEARLKIVLANAPEHLQATILLGHCLVGLGRRAEGLQLFQKGHEMDPEGISAAFELAKLYHREQNLDLALTWYRRVLERDPFHLLAGNNLVTLAFDLGDEALQQETLETAERLQLQYPAHPVVANLQGWIHYHRDELDAARNLLEEAVTSLPDAPEVHYHLAAVYFKQGEAARARRSVEKALALSADFSGVQAAQALLEKVRH